MSLISFSNVSKSFGTDLLLDHISFNINLGEKVALVGPNGIGKSTIFKLILKEEFPTLMPREDKAGEISILNGINIGYLSQQAICDVQNTVYEELRSVFKGTIEELEKLNIMSEELNYNNEQKKIEEYNDFLDYLNDKNAFSIESKIKGYVSKFHFSKEILDKKIETLSGGERIKIAFIKLLLEEHDILLLDEPTNHLDISTIEWLEEYLKNYKGTVLFISHDRYFLNSVADKILDLDNKKVVTYNLNYDDYLKEKELRFQQELAQFEKEEEEMERLKRFIEYFMPKPRFVGRAKDRVHKLEKLEANHIDKPTKENRSINLNLDSNNLKNKRLMTFEEVSAGYNGIKLFNPFNFVLFSNERLAIVGDNGIGKTTLIKSIMNQLPLTNGNIIRHRELSIGYIKQNDYDLSKYENCFEYLRNKYPNKLDKELRGALGSFLFKKDEVFKPCSVLSHGEQMRLILCGLSLSSYDVLILDEPTNHLDLVVKECLLSSLKKYNGAIIFISHDRYFINELATYTLYLSKEITYLTEGSYDDLKFDLENKIKIEVPYVEKEVKTETKIINKNNKLSNNKRNDYLNKLKVIEKRLEEIEIELSKDIDYQLINNLTEEREKLETEYLEISSILEE